MSEATVNVSGKRTSEANNRSEGGSERAFPEVIAIQVTSESRSSRYYFLGYDFCTSLP